MNNAGVASRSASGRACGRGWVFHRQELPATIGVDVGRDDVRMGQAPRGNAALSSRATQLEAICSIKSEWPLLNQRLIPFGAKGASTKRP
jgi:hypothetical protein